MLFKVVLKLSLLFEKLFVEGLVDVVAGKAQGDGGVDVAVHIVALETEFVELGYAGDMPLSSHTSNLKPINNRNIFLLSHRAYRGTTKKQHDKKKTICIS